MGYKLGDNATVNIIDKKNGKIITTQEIQTSDISYNKENKEINVKVENIDK